MRAWLVGWAVPFALVACGPDARDRGGDGAVALEGAAANGGGQRQPGPDDDSDEDGVCDLTELDLGSDPERADSDSDGLPDFIEVISGFDPVDPLKPGPDQVAHLAGAPHAELTFGARLTVEGSGQSYNGEFSPATTYNPTGLTAEDFFAGAVAQGADPTDNVRGMQPSLERFGSVIGRTRLSFELYFQYGGRQGSHCTGAYPYLYRVKADNDQPAIMRNYLLVVSAKPNAKGRPSFCPPAECL